MKKRLLSLLLSLVLVIGVCVPASAEDAMMQKNIDENGNVVFTTSEIPNFLPDDAPEPAPNAEISIIYWMVDENGNVVTYDPSLRTTVSGTNGTAAIYVTSPGRVYWGVTSKTKGTMVFVGLINHDVNGKYYESFGVGGFEFDGSCDGEIYGNYRIGSNKYTLSGFMIDANGLSLTLPDVSTSVYVYG